MFMGKNEALAGLVDEKKLAVLRILVNSPEEMYLKEISEKSNVSLASTFRILQELMAQEIIRKRQWKTSKVYHCQANEKVDFLKELFQEEFDGLNYFLEAIKDFAGIQQVILQGERKKNKANVLLIGEYINSNRIEEISQELRQKSFDLSFVALNRSQYEQMSRMGFYAGEKKVLR